MAKTIITPLSHDLAEATSTDEKHVFWKQILPKDEINYEGEKIDFNDDYFSEVIDSFQRGALKQVPLQLADKDNSHTMAVERQGGVITDLRRERDGEAPGLYAKIEASEPVAKLIKQYPKIGVSARIRNENERVDGEKFGRHLIHVLATNDPKVVKLDDWKSAADFSEYDSDDVLDLSSLNYSEAAVGKQSSSVVDLATKPVEELTAEDFDAMMENLDELSDERIAEVLDYLGEVDSEGNDDGNDDGGKGADDDNGGTTLSNEATRDIALANTAAKEANDKASRALAKLADANWEKTQADLLARGVPAHCIALSEPVLHRHEDAIVDLSNSGGPSDVNFTEIVLSLLDELEGTVDLSEEAGHGAPTGEHAAQTAADAKAYRAAYGL